MADRRTSTFSLENAVSEIICKNQNEPIEEVDENYLSSDRLNKEELIKSRNGDKKYSLPIQKVDGEEDNDRDNSPNVKTILNRNKIVQNSQKKSLFSNFLKKHSKVSNSSQSEETNTQEIKSSPIKVSKKQKSFSFLSVIKDKIDEIQEEDEAISDEKEDITKINFKNGVNKVFKKYTTKKLGNKNVNNRNGKKPTLKYTPDFDLNKHLELLQKVSGNKQGENIKNVEQGKENEIKKRDSLINDETDHDQENEKKKFKVYSKYSNLVLGDRMSESRKIQLGIIHRQTNKEDTLFKKRKDLGLGIFTENLEKKRLQPKSTKNSFSLIRFIPQKIEINGNKVDNHFHFPTSAALTTTNVTKKRINLDTQISAKDYSNTEKLNTQSLENLYQRISLNYLIKEQFNLLKIENLKEPEKIMECSQDRFVRDKNDYVLEIQHLNRNIEKEVLDDKDKIARNIFDDIEKQEAWQSYTTLLFANLKSDQQYSFHNEIKENKTNIKFTKSKAKY